MLIYIYIYIIYIRVSINTNQCGVATRYFKLRDDYLNKTGRKDYYQVSPPPGPSERDQLLEEVFAMERFADEQHEKENEEELERISRDAKRAPREMRKRNLEP